jgi:hypothetical protein
MPKRSRQIPWVDVDAGMNTGPGPQVHDDTTFTPSVLDDSHYALNVLTFDEIGEEDAEGETEVFERTPEGLREGATWLERFGFRAKLRDDGKGITEDDHGRAIPGEA